MIILSCKNIHKSYGIDVILDDISFNVDEGDKIGLIGANGAGKSTLFKIINGDIDYDSGEIFIGKDKKIGYLSQHLSLDSTNTIYNELLLVFNDLIKLEDKILKLEEKMNIPYDSKRESYHNKIINDYTNTSEIYKRKGGHTYKGEIHKMLTGLGFNEDDFHKPINILSGGEKTRVALCKLLLQKPDILLLDEPTNHLDLDAIEWLEEYLQNYKGTILTISHDRFFLDSVTFKTFEILNGHIDCYNGNYTKFIDLKEKNYEAKLKAYNNQQSEIKRQEEIIERYRSFNREKSVKAARSREKVLSKIEKIESPDKEGKPAKIKFETQIKSGFDVIHIEDLSKSYDENLLFEDLNMDIKRGEKIALIGDNGRGKTTLFKIIMNKIKNDSGFVSLGKNVFIGYYDQEQSNLNLNKSVLDEVWDDFPGMTTTEIRNALAAFLFKGDDVFKNISSLSGGEKCKINLLKLMLSKSNFLLLDEPTNHLDIMSREALENAILNYDGTILLISHDRYFLNKVVNKIYELEQDGVKEYLGNYNYYVQKKKNPMRFESEEPTAPEKTKTQIQNEKKEKRRKEKEEEKKKKQLEDIENTIAKLEKEIAKYQKDLCLEEVYSDPEKSSSINNTIKDIQDQLKVLYEKWERLL